MESGLIQKLEALIGAPLSDEAKKTVEVFALSAASEGVALGLSAHAEGQRLAREAMGYGATISQDASRVGADMATGKIMEAALEPVEA